MPHPTPSELKKTLQARGFEIYRTTADEVVLAERVRDNLMMDSAVAARLGEPLAVRLVTRAQSADFPGESPDGLFSRARKQAESAVLRGFRETGTKVVPIRDPGDRTRTLDTWYEVWFERSVSDVTELESELRIALSLEKSARG
ncbi:MAG TPA: hypothetical protein VG937_32535 [Polyangiaceae bacterium]|jgi:hypothetical protein|nr:hypothetical protein [Polyangiaceae bacterium]